MRHAAVGYRPGRNRLVRPTDIKIKALNVVPKQSDIAAASDGVGWGTMWANFDWTGWIKPQVDLAKAKGANCVKITGSGATGAYPSADVCLTRWQRFLDYCAAQGLYVYWNYGSGDTGVTNDGVSITAAVPHLQAVAQMCARNPHVIGLDVANEVGLFGVTAAQAVALLAVGRAAGPVPVTASLSAPSAAYYTDAKALAVVPSCDFADLHAYNNCQSSDFATYRTTFGGKPFLIGESGMEVSGNSNAAVTARWTALGATSAAASDCFGVVGFSITDYGGAGNEYGMYAADLTTERTQISTPFAAWPAHA